MDYQKFNKGVYKKEHKVFKEKQIENLLKAKEEKELLEELMSLEKILSTLENENWSKYMKLTRQVNFNNFNYPNCFGHFGMPRLMISTIMLDDTRKFPKYASLIYKIANIKQEIQSYKAQNARYDKQIYKLSGEQKKRVEAILEIRKLRASVGQKTITKIKGKFKL